MKKNKAFTLSEILITLGIIGVVSALTIPTLVNNYQKKLFVTKMKYTYSLLSNALALSILENGATSTWFYGKSFVAGSGYDKSEDLSYIVNTYFKPYLKISEDLSEKIQSGNSYSIVLNNGITLTFFTDGGKNEQGIFGTSVIYIVASNNKNTESYEHSSRDFSRHDMIFEISFRDNRLFPFCFGEGGAVLYSSIKNREDIINHSSYGCRKNIAKNRRRNCGALIMFDNWEIKDDYPW